MRHGSWWIKATVCSITCNLHHRHRREMQKTYFEELKNNITNITNIIALPECMKYLNRRKSHNIKIRNLYFDLIQRRVHEFRPVIFVALPSFQTIIYRRNKQNPAFCINIVGHKAPAHNAREVIINKICFRKVKIITFPLYYTMFLRQ